MSSRGAKVQEVYVGTSESGKSTRIKVAIMKAKPTRLAVFDPKREYAAFVDRVIDGERPGSLQELGRLVLQERKFRVAFQPIRSRQAQRAQFNVFCQLCDEAANMAVVADELADVTEPNWAPEGWEMLTRAGRHAGLVVLGASQSPCDLDKTFYRNCSRIVIFRLFEGRELDRMAKMISFERADAAARRAEIASLKTHESLVIDTATRQVQKISTTPRELARLP